MVEEEKEEVVGVVGKDVVVSGQVLAPWLQLSCNYFAPIDAMSTTCSTQHVASRRQ